MMKLRKRWPSVSAGRRRLARRLRACWREFFASYGLILLDPLDERLHRLAAPVLQRDPGRTKRAHVELLARDKRLEQAGYHSQVKVTDRTTLLFATVDGQRVAIRRRNGHFLIGEKELAAAGAGCGDRARAGSHSARTLYFGRWCRIICCRPWPMSLGPSEMAYFAQSNVVYRHGLGHMPVIVPRASFTLIEPSIERLLERYDIEIQDVFRGRQHLRGLARAAVVTAQPGSAFHRAKASCARFSRVCASPSRNSMQRWVERSTRPSGRCSTSSANCAPKSGRAVDLRTGIMTRA